MQNIQNLRPDSFTISDLNKELVSMTMIRALPTSYASFASSLQLLDKLDKDALQSAFVNEEALRNRSSTSGASALFASLSSQLSCSFCSFPGQPQDACICYKRMKEQATQDTQEKCKQRGGKGKNNANNASTAPSTAPTTAAVAQEATEFAGQASVRLSSHSTPAELATHLLWNADTGATSHMTPHKHWLHNYSPLRIPVRLANDQIVYSEGVGSVVFAPEVKGHWVRE